MLYKDRLPTFHKGDLLSASQLNQIIAALKKDFTGPDVVVDSTGVHMRKRGGLGAKPQLVEVYGNLDYDQIALQTDTPYAQAYATQWDGEKKKYRRADWEEEDKPTLTVYCPTAPRDRKGNFARMPFAIDNAFVHAMRGKDSCELEFINPPFPPIFTRVEMEESLLAGTKGFGGEMWPRPNTDDEVDKIQVEAKEWKLPLGTIESGNPNGEEHGPYRARSGKWIVGWFADDLTVRYLLLGEMNGRRVVESVIVDDNKLKQSMWDFAFDGFVGSLTAPQRVVDEGNPC